MFSVTYTGMNLRAVVHGEGEADHSGVIVERRDQVWMTSSGSRRWP